MRWWTLLALLAAAAPVAAQDFPERPDGRINFVVDAAGMMQDGTEESGLKAERAILAEHFPADAEDKNELHNGLRAL